MSESWTTFDRYLFEIAAACNRLTAGDEVEELPSLLHSVAELSGADACRIVLCSPKQRLLSIAHQWVEDGREAQAPIIDASQDEFPWLLEELSAAPHVAIADAELLPDSAALEKRDFERQRISSFTAAGLRHRDAQLGFLLVYSPEPRKEWDSEVVRFITECADTFAQYIGRSRAEHKMVSYIGELEKTVEQTEARYGSILESLAEGLIMADKDGYLTYCNTRFCEITAYPKSEILGRRVYEVFFQNSKRDISEEVERMHERYEARKRGLAEEYELEVTRKDGEVRWLEVRAAPLRDTTGKIVGSIGMNIDITERKQLEAQLRWSQKMEAVGRLAGGVAHDFNNLLTVISGYANMLLSRVAEGDANRKRIQAIRDASEAACSLTQQLLTVSRRQVVQPKVLNLNEVIEHTIGIIQGLIGEDITLITDLQHDLPFVEVDPGQLQQIIMNLAVNAKDAMPEGGELRISTFEAEPEPASTSAKRNDAGEYIALSMSDTGQGMDEETQAHLFEPFFTTKKGGTGLGLSTIYGIIKQHGGNISVQSQPDEGTTFTVHFKRARAGAALEGPAVSLQAQGGDETILLVEDESAVRELVRDTLEQKGYRVIEACHGGEALSILAQSKESFDMVLTDIVMPQVNGFELYEKVMRQKPDIQVLMMSGCTHDSTIPKNILKYGIPFLPKPFSPEVLADKVRTVLDTSKSAAQKRSAAQ